jgi:hypothetical protein
LLEIGSIGALIFWRSRIFSETGFGFFRIML